MHCVRKDDAEGNDHSSAHAVPGPVFVAHPHSAGGRDAFECGVDGAKGRRCGGCLPVAETQTLVLSHVDAASHTRVEHIGEAGEVETKVPHAVGEVVGGADDGALERGRDRVTV
eukprot:3093989-Prymnesium_polylepis.2